MTFGDVMAQVLSEVTPLSRDEALGLFRKAQGAFSGKKTRIDEELPDKQAEELLSQLRAEGPGILAWCVRLGILTQHDIAGQKPN